MAAKDVSKMRVAIIGAGPSGTAALRAFQSAKAKGAKIPEVVCFEKASEIGGLWNYSWRTGVDAHGLPEHGSMYRYLWSNGPKEGLEFADYGFEEHFGKIIPSYPPREVLFDYIKGRVQKANVRPWIRLNTAVRDVSFDEKTDKFTVISRELKASEETSEEFDNVVVATGHFSSPNVPYFKGFEKFEGRVLHAHDFRDAREFTGKDILIIGTSYSAEDIASQCYKYGTKTITCSWRTAPMPWKWPDNFSTVPLLTEVKGKTAFFKDGTSKEVDAIILCTGYKHSFPFLPDSLRLKTANRLWIEQLYKGVALMSNPKLLYLGMQDQWYTFNMFDAQAWWARDLIMGKIQAPSKEDMQKDWDEWRAREDKIEDDYQAIEYQGSYVKHLTDQTDYPKTLDIDGVNKVFFEWKKAKKKGIMNFRDTPHKSLMTGNMGTVHHTTWLEALDDSMECYLADKPANKV